MSKWGSEEVETLKAIKTIGFHGNILNLAAGDGRFNDKLLQLSNSVTAIDIDDLELQALRDNCPKNLKDKLTTRRVDITQEFPFHDAAFDGIFCTGTLHLFDRETIIKILQEIRRILKPNGRIILDFATDIKRLDKKGNQVVFDGEGNYSIDEALSLFNEQLKDFTLNIETSTFTEDELEDYAGYNSITGKFLIISGMAKERSKTKLTEIYYEGIIIEESLIDSKYMNGIEIINTEIAHKGEWTMMDQH